MINRYLQKYYWMTDQVSEMVKLSMIDIDGYSLLISEDYFLNKTGDGKRMTEAELDKIIRGYSPDDYD